MGVKATIKGRIEGDIPYIYVKGERRTLRLSESRENSFTLPSVSKVKTT